MDLHQLRDPLLDPDCAPPPRQLQPWTAVEGHLVTAPNSTIGFCSCGEQEPPLPRSDDREARRRAWLAWRDDHLRNAWPILCPRWGNESVWQHLDRLESAHIESQQALIRAMADAGLNQPVRPGGPYPVITPEVMHLENVQECLAHQLAALRSRLGNLVPPDPASDVGPQG